MLGINDATRMESVWKVPVTANFLTLYRQALNTDKLGDGFPSKPTVCLKDKPSPQTSFFQRVATLGRLNGDNPGTNWYKPSW